MSFSKIREGEDMVFEIKAWAPDGGKIEQWRCMKVDFPRIVKILSKKYGFKIYVKETKEDRDLDWAI